MIPSKRFDIFTPVWVMLRRFIRFRCVQTFFFEKHCSRRAIPFQYWYLYKFVELQQTVIHKQVQKRSRCVQIFLLNTIVIDYCEKRNAAGRPGGG